MTLFHDLPFFRLSNKRISPSWSINIPSIQGALKRDISKSSNGPCFEGGLKGEIESDCSLHLLPLKQRVRQSGHPFASHDKFQSRKLNLKNKQTTTCILNPLKQQRRGNRRGLSNPIMYNAPPSSSN